ncbi:41788_t:CDS:10, partial [Gigaspora margarita]
NAICNNSYIFEAGPLDNNENDQSLEDYCSLFNDDNEEELSQLIDDYILNEETNLPQFNEINFELKTLNFQKIKNSFEKYQNLIPSSKKVVILAYWGILDLTKESLFNWKEIDNKLLNEELKMITVFLLIHGIFSKNLIDDKWGEVQSLATNEARNESNNPFQRAKVGHKADMKGILKNTSCKLEALYGEVFGGLGPFGLSIASRKKKYLDKKHINDDNRKSLVVYGFTQDGLEISFYAMSWFEEIYLFGRIDSCTIPSEENNCYLFEEIYCVLTELESKLKKTEEIVRKLHSHNITNKRKLLTHENKDCYLEIIKNFEYDHQTLYNCLLVNRTFCLITLPLLWADPLYNISEHSINIISIYLSYLNENEKHLLTSSTCQVDLSCISQKTLFEYADFLETYSSCKIKHATSLWYQNTQDISMPNLEMINSSTFPSITNSLFSSSKLKECEFKFVVLNGQNTNVDNYINLISIQNKRIQTIRIISYKPSNCRVLFLNLINNQTNLKELELNYIITSILQGIKFNKDNLANLMPNLEVLSIRNSFGNPLGEGILLTGGFSNDEVFVNINQTPEEYMSDSNQIVNQT